MIEARLRKIVDEYPDIIKGIERLEISEEDQIAKLKAKLLLFDGNILWIREIWVKEAMEAYSYYWLRPDGTVMIGWDNAPHHKEIKTFPHHRHVGNEVEISQETDLAKVLSFIKNYVG